MSGPVEADIFATNRGADLDQQQGSASDGAKGTASTSIDEGHTML